MTPRQLTDKRLEAICARYGLTLEQLRSPDKRHATMQARYDAWLDISLELDWSTSQMGRRLNRDHSTIIYGRQRAAQRRFGLPPKAHMALIREAALMHRREAA